MSKNQVQKGENLTIPAPYNVASGGGVKSGLIFGVASGDALSGADVDIATVGVFDLPKVSTNTFAIGAACYWNDTAKLITSTTSGNTKIGVAVEAKLTTETTVRVRLVPSI